MNKKKIGLMVMAISASLLVMGCMDNTEKKLELGKNYLNEGKYEEAKKEFDEILEKHKDNVEAKNLDTIIEDYEKALADFNEGKTTEAKETLEKMPNEYQNFNIKEKVDSLKEKINLKLEKIEKNNKGLENIDKLIKNNEVVKAREEINSIEKEQLLDGQKELLEKSKLSLDKKIEENKKVEEKKKAEEAKRKKDLEIAKKKKEEEQKKLASAKKTYISKALGIKFEIPSNWAGYYKISETADSISFSYVDKQNPSIVGTIGGIMTRSEDAMFLDSTIKKTINGKTYMIGTPTDIGTNAYDINRNSYNRFKEMQRQLGTLANSIR